MSMNVGVPAIYVVIPACNEAAVVGEVVRRVRSKFSHVVVVDDGSSDETGAICRAGGAAVVTHLINRGQGAALKTAIEYALMQHADIVVTFDSDGQHRLEDVDALLAPVLSGAVDVALGSRFLSADDRVPIGRKVILKLGVLFTRVVSRIRITDTHNGLRAFSRKAAAQIQFNQDRMAHASEILDEIGRLKLRFCEVPVRIVYTEYSRQKGQRSLQAFRIVWDLLLGGRRR
ncbi:MAG: glycosyltransferase family 2 protein [Vicinamibacterales bacterium]